jgi:putative transposase
VPRKPRFFLPNLPVHVVQRGNNRLAVFFDDDDRRVYLDRLGQAASENGCAIHAHALVTNHVHLLMTPADGQAVSATLQALGRRFVPHVNHRRGRTGTLWEGRFKASPVQEDRYLFACYRYIELNPLRAGMVERPEDWPWSSYRANALGEQTSLLSPHPLYLSLGADADQRRMAYRSLFDLPLDPRTLGDVRTCLQTGTPLGSEDFRERIGRSLGVDVGYSDRGRPKKTPCAPVQSGEQRDFLR